MKKSYIAGAILAAATTAALASNVGMSGLGQSFNNMQPSLVITEALPMVGLFPTRDTSAFANGGNLGFVYQFAGTFAPGASLMAQGQSLQISQNTAVFSLMGTTYGGNGMGNFVLPDLAGTAVIGAGAGVGLSVQDLGARTGSASTTLSVANLPSHHHTLSVGGVTGANGAGQTVSNLQPSLPMRVVIALSGIFPSQGSGGVAAAFFGQIGTFVGSFVPGGWAEADGRLLSIMGNEALFSVIGTIYGGNGTSTFALPDLRGRVAVGANASNPVGSAFGVESNVVGLSQMPVHDHSEASGGTTASSGGNQSLNNDQPSLAVNYLIATRGIFPSNGGGLAGFDPDTQVLGQITEFAGNYAPDGWEIADGKLLQIAQNQALFSILGTTYGGDGQSTFALPDFRGRTAIGSGNGYDPGEVFGADTSFLSVANLPMHDHTASDSAQVPEPGSIALLCVGLFALGLGWRRPVRRTVFFSVRQRENTKMGLKMQFWRICSES